MGMFISLVALLLGFSDFNDTVRFDDDVFFYIALPPIVFAAGYNLKRKKFFQHFNYIALFGILGTFVCFTVFSFLTYYAFELIPMTKW